MKLRSALLSVLCSVGVSSAVIAAETYPNKPVRVVVGFSAGGPTDVAARIISEQMSKELGQPFVVENKPGASGTIAVNYVVGQKPDGYTIVMGNSGNMSVLPYLNKSLGYNPLVDLSPIGLAVKLPSVLAVPKNSPFESVQDLVSYAKANPDKLSYASQGNGSLVHISSEWFKLITGTQIVHVPYKGDAPSIQDIVAGRVDMSLFSIVSALPLLQADRIRVLGVATADPIAEVPGVPTIMSQGVDNFVSEPWNAFLAPAETDPEVINKLNAALQATLANPTVLEGLKKVGLYPMGGTPEDLKKYMEEQSALWEKVIDAAEISIE